MQQILCDLCGKAIKDDEDLRFELEPTPPNQIEKSVTYSYARVLSVELCEEEYKAKDNDTKELFDSNALDICRKCVMENLGAAIAKEKAKTEREE